MNPILYIRFTDGFSRRVRLVLCHDIVTDVDFRVQLWKGLYVPEEWYIL